MEKETHTHTKGEKNQMEVSRFGEEEGAGGAGGAADKSFQAFSRVTRAEDEDRDVWLRLCCQMLLRPQPAV